MTIQHKHLLLQSEVHNPIYKENEVVLWLEHLVNTINMKIVCGPYVKYVETEGNRGITATVMIETSHIAFHVWDEKNPGLLQFDLYTCGELDINKTLEEIEKFFNIDHYQYIVLDRNGGFTPKEGIWTQWD
jgi:S-adenosylmethionine/arginine decarboxylase-like enzyme